MPEANENQDQIAEFVKSLVNERWGEKMTPEQKTQEEERVLPLVLKGVEDAVINMLPLELVAELDNMLEGEGSDEQLDAFLTAHGIDYQGAASGALTQFQEEYLAGRI